MPRITSNKLPRLSSSHGASQLECYFFLQKRVCLQNSKKNTSKVAKFVGRKKKRSMSAPEGSTCSTVSIWSCIMWCCDVTHTLVSCRTNIINTPKQEWGESDGNHVRLSNQQSARDTRISHGIIYRFLAMIFVVVEWLASLTHVVGSWCWRRIQWILIYACMTFEHSRKKNPFCCLFFYLSDFMW